MQTTLCLPLDEQGERLLLGMKKRGFGVGKLNGFGGKVEKGETVLEAAVRELREESGLQVEPGRAQKVGELSFEFSAKPEWNQFVHVFLVKEWRGEPLESEEMKPEWFGLEELPYERTWADDQHWLPHVLNGLHVRGSFTFGEDNEKIDKFSIEKAENLY